ncbi:MULTISPECIES: ExbD/TolR family protein [Methylomonas]|uniref:ExbD/TolR family protein n=1 Tax=Methylomonas TaxID=416 RepID=UPI0012324310|nr:biopolymer transporter ExbD [Methylomonas rhizoryzae]
MDFRRKKRAPVDINLIPMIDVLLVLLFFFMLATTFRHHTDLKINLPEAGGEDSEYAGKTVNLFIDAQGRYALSGDDGKPQLLPEQSPEGLKNALARLPGEAGQWPFVINADGKTPHQAVVSALEAANKAGFKHVTFAINPPEKL